jgi:hypothetical protein
VTTMTIPVEIRPFARQQPRRGRPVGSRVQRAKRHLAEARRAALGQLSLGREKATDALLAAARRRAIPVRMPTGLRTVRTLGDRLRQWTLDTAASLVARKIERQTFRAALYRLEERKMSVDRWLAWMKDVAE